MPIEMIVMSGVNAATFYPADSCAHSSPAIRFDNVIEP
ncbi:Uncharacterised protein [Shigella flexneri]|nr:Uncharacterised protein [Shigella flexneri]